MIWIDGPGGNAEHMEAHGLTRAAVEAVLRNPDDVDISNSSGRLIVFGRSAAGKRMLVSYEQVDPITVYPVTAYETRS